MKSSTCFNINAETEKAHGNRNNKTRHEFLQQPGNKIDDVVMLIRAENCYKHNQIDLLQECRRN